jgi:hypothetical protein
MKLKLKINLTKGKKNKKNRNHKFGLNDELRTSKTFITGQKKLKIKRITTNLKNIIYVKIGIDEQN